MNRATEKGLMKGIKVGKENVEVSHLQFADYVILFFEHYNRSILDELILIQLFKNIIRLEN